MVAYDIVLVITLGAKRERVAEVKLHRICAELEQITGACPQWLQPNRGGCTAVLRVASWIAPDVLVRLLRARLEQESLNSGMFHFCSASGAADSIIALQAGDIAVM